MTDAIDNRLRSCPELTERTGRLGIATLCSGHQLVGQHFPGFASTARGAKWLGRTLPVAISEQHVCADPKVLTTRAEPDNARLVPCACWPAPSWRASLSRTFPATSLTSWPT
jgi:hypothetical protein